VNAVEMHGGSGWHHSNWVFAPADDYPGPDGMWDCPSRQFDGRGAAIAGGVLYAQSTQTTGETQRFLPGAAVLIPAHSAIIGETHALNASPASVETNLSLTIYTLNENGVTILLHPLVLEDHALDIPPKAQSSFAMSCDLEATNERVLKQPLNMRIHYVMPHYHRLGTGMTLEAIGGEKDGQSIFETSSPIGEPLGRLMDPPFDLTGATGLRTSCSYDNPRDAPVHWGVGDQEMCVLLAFTDSPLMWAGVTGSDDTNQQLGTAPDGTVLNQSACSTFALFPQD
jgi:hypothetical protein